MNGFAQRLMQYVTSVGVLVASFVVYQNTFVRWLEPADVESIAIKPAEQLQMDHSVEDLFPAGAWQRGSCKQLQTAEGMLLFERREQTAPNKWRLWPITVVMGRGMADNDAEPVILDAGQGAEIELSGALNVVGGGTPSIKRGRLIGPVEIYRDAAPGTESRPFALKTSNVGIDTRKIWTTDAIEMTFGEARILGRDLTIHLAGDPTAQNTDADELLDRMELIYLDDFTLPIQRKQANGLVQNSQIQLRCGGRVEYDFALNFLSLRESVSLIHTTQGGYVDQFDCQSLRLSLNDPGNRSIERKGPLDWINHLVSEGNPVVASVPSFNAEIVADRIALDASKGSLEAYGEKGIRIRRGGISASLANLFYRFNVDDPKTLGSVLVDGAGIVHVKQDDVSLRKAQWQNGLELKPIPAITTNAVQDSQHDDLDLSIYGDVRAWLVDGGEFQADEVVGRLKSVPAQDDASRGFTPEWFDINGNVRIETSAITANTDTLKLFFEEDAGPSSGYPNSSDDQTASNSRSPLRQWVSQPGQNNDGSNSTTAPVARPTPEIRGDMIVAKLRRHSAGLEAKGLKVAGNVEVKHTIQAGQQSLATTLTGDLLQLVNSGGEDVLQLGSGVESPARFDIGDGYFIGPEIQIRPSENMIWIRDAGEFRIPTDALPSSLAGGQDGSGNMKWTRPPHCRWRGEMQFDGQVAVLTDGVDIDAAIINGREPWEMKLSGDRLEVRLWEQVDLKNMQSLQTAKVRSIELLESPDRPVLMEAKQWAADGVMQSRHLMYAKKLVMTPDSNPQPRPINTNAGNRNATTSVSNASLASVIVGQGPGWYRSWMPARKPENGLVDSANATMIDDAERSLTGIHLTFNESMTANLSQNSLDFARGVRVALRQVSHWEETFDAATMNTIAIGESTLDCDRLRITSDPATQASRRNSRLLKSEPAWEMQALRGVVFRTRSERGTIQATAARASYASAKDLFTILGAPNRPALIRQTRPDGKPGMDASVKSALIRPKSMTIENAEIIGVNIAAPQPDAARR